MGEPQNYKKMIDAIAAAGFKSIRIPITWDHRMGDASDYIIDPDFLSRIKEVVDWSLDAGLYVMINMHHDSWLSVYQMGGWSMMKYWLDIKLLGSKFLNILKTIQRTYVCKHQ